MPPVPRECRFLRSAGSALEKRVDFAYLGGQPFPGRAVFLVTNKVGCFCFVGNGDLLTVDGEAGTVLWDEAVPPLGFSQESCAPHAPRTAVPGQLFLSRADLCYTNRCCQSGFPGILPSFSSR
jgi:hypothetical protein